MCRSQDIDAFDLQLMQSFRSGGASPSPSPPCSLGMSAPKRVVAAMAGNILEWYDFALYSAFAGLFGRLFFPAQDPVSSLLVSFGVFASGYLMRPLGSLLFGRLADRRSRNHALRLSLLSIAVPTVLMGLLPDYRQLGIGAPLLLMLLRMIQGLSIGGEYTTSMVWLVEQAPRDRRGFDGSWAGFGGIAGFTLGTAAGAAAARLPSAALESWGWRLPFLAAGLLAWLGWLLRRHWNEPLRERQPTVPLGLVLHRHQGAMARIAAFNAVGAVGFYLLATYLVSELTMLMRLPISEVLRISTLSLLLILVVMPLAGSLSDRWGRKPVLVITLLCTIVFGRAVFSLTQHTHGEWVAVGELSMALLLGITGGIAPAWMVEATAPEDRCTALGIGYNLSSAVMGGLTPLVATLLVHGTGNMLAPVWLWQGAAAISLLAVLSVGE